MGLKSIPTGSITITLAQDAKKAEEKGEKKETEGQGFRLVSDPYSRNQLAKMFGPKMTTIKWWFLGV